LYSCLVEKDFNQKYWTDLIDNAFEASAGDEADRWGALRDNFSLTEQLDVFEEYDGLNHDQAK